MTLCPLYTFRSYKDGKCYRDSLQGVTIDVIKRTKGDGYSEFDYALMATYSQYTNMYVLGNAGNLFNFKWELIGQSEKNDVATSGIFPEIFKERTSAMNPVISLRGDELSKRGKYSLRLTMEDK